MPRQPAWGIASNHVPCRDPVSIAMGDVNYADYLAAHLSEALNKTLEKMPDNPFRAMYDVLFAASLLDGSGPLPTPAAAPTSPEIEKYMETYRLETMIESCKFKLKKRLVPGPLGARH